jgi:membrane associated rhomboid family serine protease
MLILANVAAFIYMQVFIPGRAETLYHQFGFIPYEFFHFTDTGFQNMMPQSLSIFTSMFVHGGWLHLLSNVLYLWIFGDNVEDILGHGRYFFFYLLCGLLAVLAHGVVNIDSKIPMVGASGAIAGVLGAYLFLFPGARIRTLFIFFVLVRIIRMPAILLLGYWILLQTYSGLSELDSRMGAGIAWFAHIGGFVCGFILIMVLQKKRKHHWR